VRDRKPRPGKNAREEEEEIARSIKEFRRKKNNA
jgi:hypothetical protein